MQNLFRREVLEARQVSWLGKISLAQPISLWILTGAVIFTAIGIGSFLSCATYTRRSSVVGQLVPSDGMAKIVSPAAGVISRLDISGGDAVTAGKILAVVTVSRGTIVNGDTVVALEKQLLERRASLDSARTSHARLFDAQQSGIEAQLATARRELSMVDAEVATRKERVRIATRALDRVRQLLPDQYVSELQVKVNEAERLEQVNALQALQRQSVVTQRAIAQLRQALKELPVQQDGVEADYQRDSALLEQERVEIEARGASVVASPVTGIVATQVAKLGQSVQAGQPLFSVLPGDGHLEAELLVPSHAIGFVEPGDQVLIRYQAYPYQKFGHGLGRVASISRSALSPGEVELVAGQSHTNEPLYLVTVSLARQTITAYGRQELLKPGMLLDADILGERRKLIEWIFEPLYSLSGVWSGRS